MTEKEVWRLRRVRVVASGCLQTSQTKFGTSRSHHQALNIQTKQVAPAIFGKDVLKVTLKFKIIRKWQLLTEEKQSKWRICDEVGEGDKMWKKTTLIRTCWGITTKCGWLTSCAFVKHEQAWEVHKYISTNKQITQKPNNNTGLFSITANSHMDTLSHNLIKPTHYNKSLTDTNHSKNRIIDHKNSISGRYRMQMMQQTCNNYGLIKKHIQQWWVIYSGQKCFIRHLLLHVFSQHFYQAWETNI